jgi:hypothetical protein
MIYSEKQKNFFAKNLSFESEDRKQISMKIIGSFQRIRNLFGKIMSNEILKWDKSNKNLFQE